MTVTENKARRGQAARSLDLLSSVPYFYLNLINLLDKNSKESKNVKNILSPSDDSPKTNYCNI